MLACECESACRHESDKIRPVSERLKNYVLCGEVREKDMIILSRKALRNFRKPINSRILSSQCKVASYYAT